MALARIAELVHFEMFLPDREQAVPRGEGSKVDRPAFDHGLTFKTVRSGGRLPLKGCSADYNAPKPPLFDSLSQQSGPSPPA